MLTKLYIIGSAGIPARYGGFETFAEQFAQAISKFREVSVACSSYCYTPEERHSRYKEVNRFFINRKAHGPGSLLYDLQSLIYALRHSQADDEILILGTGPGIFLPFFRLLAKRRYYVHVDGLEWQRPKWSYPAALFLRLSRFLSLVFTHHIVIDNEGLQAYVPERYKRKTHLLKYGGDHIVVKASSAPPEDFEYALLIARAEAENQLQLIFESFTEMPGKHLVVISNLASTPYGRSLTEMFAARRNIHLKEAVYAQDILQNYREHCKVYIHGHSTGGTNPSLVEAMYAGLPVICFENSFNRFTTKGKALYFKDKESLQNSVKEAWDPAFSPPGKVLQEIARSEFTWKKVCDDFCSIR